MQLDLLFLRVLLVTYFYHKYWKLGVQGKKSKMFCSAMGNNCYNDCIVLYLCLCNKYLSHLDEFQYQENVEQHYRIYQQWSSSSCQSCLEHPEQVLSVPVLLQLMMAFSISVIIMFVRSGPRELPILTPSICW